MGCPLSQDVFALNESVKDNIHIFNFYKHTLDDREKLKDFEDNLISKGVLSFE